MERERLEGINTKVELNFEQRRRAVELESYVTDDEYATCAEIIALRDALQRAFKEHGHKYNCSAARGMERDCTCGWLEVRDLVKSYGHSASPESGKP